MFFGTGVLFAMELTGDKVTEIIVAQALDVVSIFFIEE